MAALAIDAVGERQLVNRFGPRLFVSLGNLRISVVAEEALVVHGALGAGVIAAVEAREHVPASVIFRIPAERKLLQASARSQMEVGTAMVAGAENVVGGFFFDVGLVAFVIELPAALISFAIALNHGEVAVRGRVIKGLGWGGIGGVVGGDFSEGAAHARLRKIGGDIGVAGGAEGRVRVAVEGFGRGPRGWTRRCLLGENCCCDCGEKRVQRDASHRIKSVSRAVGHWRLVIASQITLYSGFVWQAVSLRRASARQNRPPTITECY